MSTYRVAQVAAPDGRLEVVEREVPRPGPGHVRIAVEACGVCHSDVFFVNALVPGVRFPVVPGHEIAGRIEEIGEGTYSGWQVGERVAVGWFGGSCHHCTPCRQGDFIADAKPQRSRVQRHHVAAHPVERDQQEQAEAGERGEEFDRRRERGQRKT